MATLLAASWRAARRGVLERGGLQQFAFRQFLFACQARLLLQLQRPGEARPSIRCPLSVWQLCLQAVTSHPRRTLACLLGLSKGMSRRGYFGSRK